MFVMQFYNTLQLVRFAFIFFIALLLCSCAKEKETPVVDTVVIGGGLMGSSAAWYLSNQGNSVLLLEKQDSIYSYGSSYGTARIARSNNRGSDVWSFLHNNSVKETGALIDFLNSSQADKSYKIEDIYTTSPVTYVGRIRIYEKLLASLIRQKVNYEMATNTQEGKKQFDVNLPDSVLIQREYNQHSGTLNPKVLITYLHKAIRKKGNTVKYRTQVMSVKYNKKRDLFELEVKDDESQQTNTIFAKKVASAAGAYNGSILKNVANYFDTLINPKRVFLAFLKIKKEKYQALAESEKQKLISFYPVINSSKGTRKGSFFSMIEYYDADKIPVIKIGGHFQRSDIQNLDSVWVKELSEAERAWSKQSTLDYFQLLNLPIQEEDLEFVGEYSCVYSLTKSEVPFVTPIAQADGSANDRFVVLGGMSGVGAKGAMTYGLIAADILNQKSNNDSLYQVVKQKLGFARHF